MDSSNREYILDVIDKAIDYSNELESEIKSLTGSNTSYYLLDQIDFDYAENMRKTHNEVARFHNKVFHESKPVNVYQESVQEIVSKRKTLQIQIDNLMHHYNALVIQQR